MGQSQNPWSYCGKTHVGKIGCQATGEWALPSIFLALSIVTVVAGFVYYIKSSNRALAKRQAIMLNSPLID
jgi:hypothetical protein